MHVVPIAAIRLERRLWWQSHHDILVSMPKWFPPGYTGASGSRIDGGVVCVVSVEALVLIVFGIQVWSVLKRGWHNSPHVVEGGQPCATARVKQSPEGLVFAE